MESTRTLDSVFETSHRNPAQSAPSNWVHSVHHSQVLHAHCYILNSEHAQFRYQAMIEVSKFLPCVMKTGQGQAGNSNYLQNKGTTQ